jgi:hypothetical protein
MLWRMVGTPARSVTVSTWGILIPESAGPSHQGFDVWRFDERPLTGERIDYHESMVRCGWVLNDSLLATANVSAVSAHTKLPSISRRKVS